MTESDVTRINRREAASGRVSYGDAVLLHETSRSRVTQVPFLIPHSDHTEFSVKLVSYVKKSTTFRSGSKRKKITHPKWRGIAKTSFGAKGPSCRR